MKNTLYILFSLVFLSCENTLDIDLKNTNNKLTLNSELHPYENIRATVTNNNIPLTVGSYSVVKNAIVELFENDTFIEVLQYQPDNENKEFGVFRANKTVVPGATYTFKVSAKGYSTLTASEKVPDWIEDFNISNLQYPLYENDNRNTNVKLNFIDKSGEDFYLIYAFYYFREKNQDASSPDSIITTYDFDVSKKINIASEQINDYSNGLIFKDIDFDGRYVELNLNLSARPLAEYDINRYREIYLYVELRRISSSNYFYRKTYTLYRQNNNNGFNEPVLVWSNISNGFGIVSAFTREIKVIRIR